jgi:hypothetical protein
LDSTITVHAPEVFHKLIEKEENKERINFLKSLDPIKNYEQIIKAGMKGV